MKNLRILMPTIYFPPRVGGIESHVYSLAKELARNGHSVTIITTRTEKASPWHEVIEGVEVKRIFSFGKHFAGWILSSGLAIFPTLQEAPSFDVIHCHTFAFALGGTIASLLFGKPLVVTVHSSHFLKLATRPVMRGALKLVLSRANVLLSTSREIDGVVRSLLPHAVTMPIVNGVDTEKFKPTEPLYTSQRDEFVIVCPRRLVEKNGVEYLIRALPLVRSELKVKVYIAGDGPLYGYLTQLARDLGVADKIEFLRSVSNERMPALYCSGDLVVIPSLLEATSIAALEAMACERVVAASRIGGLPEILDDSVGFLFEPASPQAIASAIEKAMKCETKAKMGKLARERVVKNWSIAKVAQLHEEIYRRCLEGNGNA